MVIVPKPVNQKIEDQLDKYLETQEELKAKISDLRKSGKDTVMAELLLLEFKPMVQMARVTYDKKDIDKIAKRIEDVEHEIELVKNGTDFENLYALIKDAYEDFRSGKTKEAKRLYVKIMALYPKLPKEEQSIVYKSCVALHKKIEKAEAGPRSKKKK